MTINFLKYQGTGNDFVLIDNRAEQFPAEDHALVARLCDRRFGIGADGLILLQNKEGFDFEMVYFNADGRLSSMCGNGGRCITAFAHRLGIIAEEATFLAVDGPHRAEIKDGIVALKMQDVPHTEQLENGWFIDTGSPHVVQFTEGVKALDVVAEGRSIRYNDRFKAEGTNVNFVEQENGHLLVRTYERGVENETLSCGTGVTACALAAHREGLTNGQGECPIATPGGQLTIRYAPTGNGFENIWLVGPATFVYQGSIDLSA